MNRDDISAGSDKVINMIPGGCGHQVNMKRLFGEWTESRYEIGKKEKAWDKAPIGNINMIQIGILINPAYFFRQAGKVRRPQ